MEGKPAGTPKYLVGWLYLDLDHVPPHHVFSPRGSRLTIQCLTAELDNNAAAIFFVVSISASFRAIKTPLPNAGPSPLLVASLEVQTQIETGIDLNNKSQMAVNKPELREGPHSQVQ